MQKPDFLKPKDKVAIIAPSGRVFEKELQENLDFLHSLDLEIVQGKHLYKTHYDAYHYAGTIQERLKDFQWALDDEEIKAIWMARGGYGAVHLLDLINWEKFKQKPKWIIGYSDITAIHNHINNWDIASLHAITVKRLNCEYTIESFSSFRKALFGENLGYTIDPHPLNRLGNVKGKLVGGNLSLIYSLIGSQSSIQAENSILFVEDWNENWYHLNRMLMNLKRSGLLRQIKGLIVGSFTQMDVKSENPNFYDNFDEVSNQLIRKFIDEFDFPVCFNFPAGHIGDNRALILGQNVELNITNTQVTLDF